MQPSKRTLYRRVQHEVYGLLMPDSTSKASMISKCISRLSCSPAKYLRLVIGRPSAASMSAKRCASRPANQTHGMVIWARSLHWLMVCNFFCWQPHSQLSVHSYCGGAPIQGRVGASHWRGVPCRQMRGLLPPLAAKPLTTCGSARHTNVSNSSLELGSRIAIVWQLHRVRLAAQRTISRASATFLITIYFY